MGGDPAFACNDKLVGAYAFLETYRALNAIGAEDFCTASACSARDSEGHGTHTATTAAGSYVSTAPIFGVDRGPVSGIAPGASVIAYRALGPGGGYTSDLLAAVQQSILDGVDVLNYSISGSGSVYTDAVELAFLDAYAAGVSVNASAGNDGPGASTANHAGPWVTTVAASTFNRQYILEGHPDQHRRCHLRQGGLDPDAGSDRRAGRFSRQRCPVTPVERSA